MNRFSRRTPPLLMGLVALALMLSIFPSALHIPLVGPNGASEIAPIPGQGKQSANLSQGSAASSGGVGSGGSSVASGGAAGSTSPPPGASVLPCVGDPPRQTPDPLSPPCVNYWVGENGGATSHGVTAQYIRVVDVNSDFTRPVDYTQRVTSNDTPYIRTAKVLLHYFQAHFETYGRTVQLVGFDPSTSSFPAAEIDQKSDHPFAVVNPPQSAADNFNFGRYGIESFHANVDGAGGTFPPTSASLQQAAPYNWWLEPAADAEGSQAARWLCNAVLGHAAALSSDPALAVQTRRISLGYYAYDSARIAAESFASTVQATCGYRFDALFDVNDANSIPADITKMEGDRVTTLVCYLCNSNMYAFERDAQEAHYLPELMRVDGEITNDVGRTEIQSAYQGATAISFRWAAHPMPQTYWWQAYTATDPSGTPDEAQAFNLYEHLLQLFSAIQLAGPRLTPGTVAAGMHRWLRFATDPFSPTATYSAGKYSMVDDYMWVRWDSSGVPPGGVAPNAGTSPGATGCYRLVDGGRRFGTDASPWPVTDDAAARSDWPCTADVYSNVDAQQDARG